MKNRALIAVAAGLLMGGGIYAARRPMQRELLSFTVLHMDAPREQAMDEWLDTASDRVGVLISLWSAGKIPQRHYAIEHLRSSQNWYGPNWSRVWPMVSQALGSADLDEREPAMMILHKHDPVAAVAVAGAMLSDVDPEVRLLALRTVRASLNDPRSHDLLNQTLDDSDAQVRALAAATLAQTASADVNTAPVVEASAAVTLPEQRAGSSALIPPSPPLTAVDFTLTDLQNHSMELASFRGKTVLLNFWLTGCGPCTTEMPTLVELQNRHPHDLAILSVNVDGIGDEDAPDNTPPAPDPTTAVRAKVSKFALNFPVAIDRGGTTVAAYEGSGVPLSVLIDAQGKIRRRFVGPRSLETWEQMLSEVR